MFFFFFLEQLEDVEEPGVEELDVEELEDVEELDVEELDVEELDVELEEEEETVLFLPFLFGLRLLLLLLLVEELLFFFAFLALSFCFLIFCLFISFKYVCMLGMLSQHLLPSGET